MDLSFLRSEVSDAIQVGDHAILPAGIMLMRHGPCPRTKNKQWMFSTFALQVVWGKEPSEQSTDAFFLPNSTCTEGRNHLLQQALMLESATGKHFTYMIYTEDDSELEEVCVFVLVFVLVLVLVLVLVFVLVFVFALVSVSAHD